MDLVTAYRAEVPYETDILQSQLNAFEALGLALLDILGSSTVVGGLACSPTSPASLSVTVGPGRIYTLDTLLSTDWGVRDATGGIEADTASDHKVLKQGLLRDTTTFALTAPATSGQSIVYLIEAQFQEADAAAETLQFYNVDNPAAAITDDLPPARYNKCAVQVKAGTAATTGSEIAPAADAGWVPVWEVTVAYGDTAITAGAIVQSASAPLISVGGGGGGGSGMPTWQFLTSNYTASSGDWLQCDTSGGSFIVTLPPTPSAGDFVRIRGFFDTNPLTVARNGSLIQDTGGTGSAANLTCDLPATDILLVYDGTMWTIG